MMETSSSAEVRERRGIPVAEFVEDVQTYLNQSGFDVNSALSFLQDRLQQYKLAEMKLLAQQRDLQSKIPDIEKCLDIVATLQARKGTGEHLGIFLPSLQERANEAMTLINLFEPGA